jgi:hypothetical protein
MAKINHISHGLGPANEGHHVPGNIARDGAPKRVHAINVHDGMRTRSKSGGDALSGHEASGIDAVSGSAFVPGAITTAPDAGVQSGHPFAKAPGSKNLKTPEPSFGQRSRTRQHSPELGEAILKQAFEASNADDCAAHGRNRDGSK